MRILFCTDGSKISFNSLKNLANWVKNAVIDVICVIDWSFLPDNVSIENTNFSMSCTNMADSILEAAVNEIIKLNLTPGEKIKYCGAVVESILEQIEAENYDLILMGSHGKKGIQKWLGSVSQEIINTRKNSDYISKYINNGKKILLTTDGSNCSNDIIQNLLNKIDFENKEIHVCIVVEDPQFLFLEGNIDTNWLFDIEKKQEIAAVKTLKSIQKLFEEYNLKIYSSSILKGIPAQKIIDYSKNNNIDLIVMGSNYKSRIEKLFTESVSKSVIENVRSDIWLERCKISYNNK